MQVHRIFPIPLLQFKLSTHSEYNFNYPEPGELKNNEPVEWVSPVYTTFPRAKGDDFITAEQIDKLKRDIGNEIGVAFMHLNIKTPFLIDEFWYNIYKNKFGQEMHDHLSMTPITDPLWSGVYYHKNCEKIPTIFCRSDTNFRSQLYCGSDDSQIGDAFLGNWNPQVSDGDIILFPSYLKHYVHCDYEDVSDRVTFSFNIERVPEDICGEAHHVYPELRYPGLGSWKRSEYEQYKSWMNKEDSQTGGTQPPEMPS